MRSFVLIALLAAGLAISPARADLYKWVDDEGVTHYSDQAPAKKKTTTVEDRISVYQPDTALKRAMSAPPRNRALENRVDSLERQIQQERSQRAQAAADAAAAQKAAAEECAAQRYVDCNEMARSSYYPSVIVVGRHPRPIPPMRLLKPITGLTAGNVIGPTGIMPGEFNGPGAITAGNLVTFGSQGRGWR